MSTTSKDEVLSNIQKLYSEPQPSIHARGKKEFLKADEVFPNEISNDRAITLEGITLQKLNGWVVGIEYCDGEGYFTERAIRISSLIKQWGGYYIQSFCYARRAQRTFSVDRIISFWHVETGEIITDDVIGFLDNNIDQTREYASSLFSPYIRALTYIARCDGHFASAECDVIVHFCSQLTLRHEEALDFDEIKIRNRANNYYLSAEQFSRIIVRLDSDPNKKLFMRAIQTLIEADGRIDNAELCLGNEILHFINA